MQPFTDKDFKEVLLYIENNSGIKLPETNYEILKKFLNNRLKIHNYTINEYLNFIESNPDEFNELIDIVTIS